MDYRLLSVATTKRGEWKRHRRLPVAHRTDVSRDLLIGQGASPGRATGRAINALG
jgi:hypothetical protein